MNEVKFLKKTPKNIQSGSVHHLMESWGDYSLIDDQSLLNEAEIISLPQRKVDLKPNEVYITGTFMQADIINGNRRIYPRDVLDRAINIYMEERVKTGRALGEWNHPENRPEVDHTKAVLLIEDLWWEGNDVKGRAIVSTGDYAEGDKMASLFRIGWRPAVSSRGVGRLIGDMKKDGYMTVDRFRISVGIDIVYTPSAPDSFVEVLQGDSQNELTESKRTINNTKSGEDNESIITLINNLKNYGNSN